MSVISYLQEITDKRNKGLSSTFQPPEEGRSVQWLKHSDKHGDKDEDYSPKNVNNILMIQIKIRMFQWINLWSDIQILKIYTKHEIFHRTTLISY